MNEEEAIEKIKWSIQINNITKEINGNNTSINVQVLETVLNLLENKDKQIEQYQNMLATNDMLHVRECEKKDKIIYEIAKSNVKLKGYDVEETYINNTISFYTKYIENLERNPHWRKESRKWKLKQKNG